MEWKSKLISFKNPRFWFFNARFWFLSTRYFLKHKWKFKVLTKFWFVVEKKSKPKQNVNLLVLPGKITIAHWTTLRWWWYDTKPEKTKWFWLWEMALFLISGQALRIKLRLKIRFETLKLEITHNSRGLSCGTRPHIFWCLI